MEESVTEMVYLRAQRKAGACTVSAYSGIQNVVFFCGESSVPSEFFCTFAISFFQVKNFENYGKK